MSRKDPPRRRRWLGPALGVAFLVLAGVLLADHAAEVDWAEVRSTVAAVPRRTIALAAALALASHFTYACYDLLARRHVGHHVPTPAVLGTAFVSYAFNLNLGSLVGGVGFRMRLYTRLGLDPLQVGSVIAFSVVTNWSGWLLLAGATFALRLVQLPPAFPLGAGVMQLIGAAMMALATGYVALCFLARRREWRWRGHRFVLPSGRLAAAQVALASLNWALIGAIVWVLLSSVGYPTVLATLLSAAVVGAAAHVPAGLGVIESVFVAALASQVGSPQLIAGLLAYRAIYYLAPLVAAAVLHFTLEALARQRDGRTGGRARRPAGGPGTPIAGPPRRG